LASRISNVYDENEYDEHVNSVEEILGKVESYGKNLETKINQLKNKKYKKKNDKGSETSLKNVEKRVKGLYKLLPIVEYLSYTIAKAKIPHLIHKLVELFRVIIFNCALILIQTLIALIASGISLNDSYLISSEMRFFISIYLFWAFLPVFPLINRSFKIYMSLIRIDTSTGK
jgi:hypothetical protein